jgi:DNA polymerase-3 subunit beta
VQKAGEVSVVAERFRAIVAAENDEGTLTVETDGDNCHIRGTNAHFRVPAYPAKDFPAMPDFAATVAGTGADPAKAVFTQSAAAMLELVSRTVFATARETSRYAINGVLLKREGKKLEMVATDGRRLAVARAQLTGTSAKGDAVTCIIPSKALNIFTKLARDPEENVRIAVSDSRVYFSFEAATAGKDSKDSEKAGTSRAVLSSVLVEGSFPPYEDVIPKDQDKRVVAGRDDLSSAVRKASVLTNEESRGVRLAFTSKDKRLKLSSRAPEMGESEISISLSKFEGDDIEISFNPTFITDVLKVIPDQDVIVELKAPNRPGLIRLTNNEFVYVVMPVNLPT